MSNKAVFLDRDGVINDVYFRGGEKPIAPWSLEEFKFLPDIEDPLNELVEIGYSLFVVTNQPDITKKYVDRLVVDEMHKMILKRLPINDIIVCPHVDADKCVCRKPKPGMIQLLSKKYGLNIETSFLIGDTWRDVETGKNAKCIMILLDKPYNQSLDVKHRVKDLKSAVILIKSLKSNHYNNSL